MAKQAKRAGTTRRQRTRTYEVGQAVWVATQYDGTVLAEITAIDRHIFVVRAFKTHKTYRILSAEIL